MSRSRRMHRRRRAAAAVVLVLLLVALQLTVVGAITGTGPEGPLTEARISAARALYAAEAGVNMALRETMLAADLDADGQVGAISDDADDSTDPDLGSGARVAVRRTAGVGGPNTALLTSRGRAGPSRRAIQTTIR